MAAVYGVDTPKATVVIDVGGGSVEITRGVGQAAQFARSFKLGAIRLTERFVTSDPLSGRDERKMVAPHHRSGRPVPRSVSSMPGYDRVIGTSGTILSLGTVATAIDRGSVPTETRNLRVPAKSIRRLRKQVDRSDARAAAPAARARPAPRRPHRRRRGAARHAAAPAQRGRNHALRSRAARRARARLHPPPPLRHRARRSLSRRAAALDDRAGRAVQLGGGACPSGEPSRPGAVRPDGDASRPGRSRARVAGIRRAAARHRQPHQLRASTIAIRIT